MLKRERMLRIIKAVNERGIVTVKEIMAELDVSDMTVRRDLAELEENGQLVRVHGGAQSLQGLANLEKSNQEKQVRHVQEKEAIADLAAQMIEDGETIFIGPGTTLESLARRILDRRLRVVTNSLPIFTILADSKSLDLILIGGEYRAITGAFVGKLAYQHIQSLQFSKAFIGANAIYDNAIATYSEAEGIIQQQALDNAQVKTLLIDHDKFDKFDFYSFYKTEDLDYLITDQHLSTQQKKAYAAYTKIIN